MNLASEQGKALADKYRAGSILPLYVLADSTGDPITRWAGYSGAARFVGTLTAALRDPVTVTHRAERFQTSPSIADAFFLARFYAGVKEHLKSAGYYRAYERLSGAHPANVSLDLFKEISEAAWEGLLPFDSAAGAIAPLLNNSQGGPDDAIAAIKILARLARKTGHEHDLEPYLRRGIEIASQANPRGMERNRLELRADYLFYVKSDTGAAIDTFEASLGDNWMNDPVALYSCGHWLVERQVRLEQAKEFLTGAARDGVEQIGSASVYDLARIFEYQKRYVDAVKMLEYLTDQYDYNRYYEEELERVRALAVPPEPASETPE